MLRLEFWNPWSLTLPPAPLALPAAQTQTVPSPPRPLAAVSGDRDHIWPYAGVAAVVDSARQIYAAFGAAEALVAARAEGGHRFYPETAWRSFFSVTKGR